MDNKNLLTDKLGEIDGKFLDECHNRRSRRALRRKSIMKYGSLAASVMIVIAISLMAMLPAFRNTPAGNPIDTSTGGIDNVDTDNDNSDSSKDNPTNNNNKPDYSNYTVIYAEEKDYSLSDNVVVEDVYLPPKPGKVRFSGGLYEILKSDELYKSTLFAVQMSFNMEFEKSVEYETLLQEHYDFWLLLWEKYDNEIVPHYKSHSLSHGGRDITCEECLRLSDIHEKDLADYNAMGEQIRSIEESDRAAHAEKVKERAEAYISSLGLEFKNVNVIWSDEPEKVNEFTKVWKVQFTYLTKEQLASFEAPDDLGIEFTLLPEWMDVGEDVIYRSNGQYPVTLD
ncbi:MAG: hypothetical protein IKU48_03510 [Clostridia bacterium]|nr:hypothetical protein [Clostridia bacterium]